MKAGARSAGKPPRVRRSDYEDDKEEQFGLLIVEGGSTSREEP